MCRLSQESITCSHMPTFVTKFVSEFHIPSHLLCWASGKGGATNSLPHVLHMGVSCGRYGADGTLNSTQSNNHSTSSLGARFSCSEQIIVPKDTCTRMSTFSFSGDLMIIDYEWVKYGYEAYDIGGLFVEGPRRRQVR